MSPDARFNKFDRNDLEKGLRQMSGDPKFSEDLKESIRQEILHRIEHQDYESDCRARKALTGGYDG